MVERKFINKKAGISYLEIFLLIASVFAFSYLVYQVSLPSVSAQDEAVNTCLVDNQGAICQEYPVSICEDNCEQDCFPGQRQDYSECELGCCFNPTEGTCSASSPKARCENDGGEWHDDGSCNIIECEKGCCMLGNEARFVTETRCERLSSMNGLNKVFLSDINSESACILLSEVQDKGACLTGSSIEGDACQFTTRQECVSITGDNSNFYKDYLCTNSELNTTCSSTEQTTCVEREHGVYFLDSCGNIANIYDASKINDEDYWNFKVDEDELCNLEDGLENADFCGNCKFEYGSTCGRYRPQQDEEPEYGDYVCRDLNCYDAPANVGTKDRENLESWCVYDGQIGEGKDVVGSRHWKYSCVEGEVKVEPCADFRNEICVESYNEDLDFSSASCRINQWQKCIDTNSKPGQECEGIDCFVQNVNVDDGFQFDVCAPKYPEGFDIKNQGSMSSAEEICGMATQTCTVVYIKKMDGSCVCEQNCNCETIAMTQQMNKLCTSLGDCGGYVNIEEVYSDEGYSIVNAPKLSQSIINGYKSLAKAVAGQFAEPGTLQELSGDITGFPQEGEQPTAEGGDGGGVSTGALAAAGAGTMGIGWLLSQKGGAFSGIKSNLGKIANVDLLGGVFGGGTYSSAMPVSAGTSLKGFVTEQVAANGMPIVEITSAGEFSGSQFVASSIGETYVGETVTVQGSQLSSVSAVEEGVAGLSSTEAAANTAGETAVAVAPNSALAAFANLAMVTGIIMTIAPLVASMFGIQTSSTGMIAGTAAGVAATYGSAIAGIMSAKGLTFGQAATLALTGSVEIGTGTYGFSHTIIGGLTWQTLAIGIAVAVAVMAFFKIAGIGEVCKKVRVTYTCKPWQPPDGGDDCDKCNDEFKTCSKYRCQSLGKACQFLNEGTDQEMCVAEENDGISPQISPWYDFITPGYNYTDVDSMGFEIINSNSEDGCVQAFTPLAFGITTDETSQCKIDVQHTEKYEDMLEHFGGSNVLLKNHSMIFSLPSGNSLANQYNISSEIILEQLGDMNLYVRCKDSWGNTNTAEYSIKLCVKPGPDLTAPRIDDADPNSGSYLALGETTKNVKFWINEPAECKWDIRNRNFDNMENTMDCEEDVLAQQSKGYPCNALLTNLTREENRIFVRCKDQPELKEINESARNTMQESYEYILKSSESDLEIQEITPSGEILSGTTLTTLNIETRTSGGAENGRARCLLKINDGTYHEFSETYSNVHEQVLTNRPRGIYNIDVKCEDVAGNIAEDFVRINLKVDSSSPIITRAFYSGGLNIHTNENSECAYTFNTCNFNFQNATLMSGQEKEHSTEWNPGKTYYIKCKDEFENKPAYCSIIIRPYDI
jgi:hypothetical protein